MSGYTVKISIEDAHLHGFTFPNSDISVSLPEAATFGKPLSEKNTIIDDFIHDYNSMTGNDCQLGRSFLFQNRKKL